MRLNKKQMRVIQDCCMKRGDWAGKDVTVWHEQYGQINFGKGKKNELRSIRRRARAAYHASDFRQVGALRYD